MKAADVFTPGRTPTYTFVDDHLVSAASRDALDVGSTLISISGPSKSGKTAFVEMCLGRPNLVQVTHVESFGNRAGRCVEIYRANCALRLWSRKRTTISVRSY